MKLKLKFSEFQVKVNQCQEVKRRQLFQMSLQQLKPPRQTQLLKWVFNM